VIRENLRPTESEKAKRKSDSWQRLIALAEIGPESIPVLIAALIAV
jgi:hypothetical protein